MAVPNSTSTLNVNNVTAGPDGLQLAPDTDDLLGFFGKTPVGRAATIASVAVTGATNTTPYGFTTAAQANAIVTSLNACLVALKAHDLLQ